MGSDLVKRLQALDIDQQPNWLGRDDLVNQWMDDADAALAEAANSIEADADRITELEAALAASNARAEAAEAEAARLREENAALKKPDHYWEWDDPESGYDSFEDAVELADGMSKVVRLLTAKSLPDVWATRRVLTVDEHGDWDETEIVCFDNREEAERCWPESLAAARAALGAGQ